MKSICKIAPRLGQLSPCFWYVTWDESEKSLQNSTKTWSTFLLLLICDLTWSSIPHPFTSFLKTRARKKIWMPCSYFCLYLCKRKRGNSKALICERGNGSPEPSSPSWPTTSWSCYAQGCMAVGRECVKYALSEEEVSWRWTCEVSGYNSDKEGVV